MINKTAYMESTGVNPYENLAVEEYLFSQCGQDEIILYLWQNENTVVVGKNQNIWQECRVSKMREDGVAAARRISGGGAVFHDLGNLNFTFLSGKGNYDLGRQLEVILRAVRKLGIQTEVSGRNDILAGGRKFSGNAFYECGGRCCHHGTLMVDVNLDKLNRYLNVSGKKLESKGINSVRSRVTNLVGCNPNLTVSRLKEALKETFEEVYGHKSRAIKENELSEEEVRALYEKYSSWDWIYGKRFEFQYEVSERFAWGQLGIRFRVDGGKIVDVSVDSDSLKTEVIEKLREELKGIQYHNRELGERMRAVYAREGEEMFREIGEWLRRAEL